MCIPLPLITGVGFAEHEKIPKSLDAKMCFAHSYWERGLNENFNVLLRRHIPKGTDLRWISDERNSKGDSRVIYTMVFQYLC